MKKRVLYVTDTLRQRAGVTSVIMNYLRNIDYKKIQIDVLAYEDSEMEIVEEINALGGKVHYMPALGLRNIPEFIVFIKRFFEANKYDIVHSHFCQIDSIIFPIAKKRGVNCCISHSHNTKYSDYRVRAIRNWLMCIPIKKVADYWAACSNVAGQFLYGKNYETSKRAILIKNAINCRCYAYNEVLRENVRKQLGITSEFVIGFVGGLRPQKNVLFLINVFAKLISNSNKETYKLMIVGAGEQEEEIRNKARELNVYQNVIFMGQRNDVAQLMQAMDVFLLPSLYEGLGLVLVEAQVAGLPCVASSEVPKEVDFTGNVQFVSLNESLEYWAEKVNTSFIEQRRNYFEEARNAGYEIEDAAFVLEKFYCEGKNE